MVDVYQHEQGQDFKRLPEIAQIEVCSACNLECPMCLRTTHLGRQPGLVKMDLLELMYERGDFEGSTYIELQMAGEPTLHPKLGEIIRFLKYKVGVLVGLSTHGLQIEKSPNVLDALLQLNALTISVDSVDPETYHKMRYPANLPDLYRNLEILFAECKRYKENRGSKLPMIELQLIKTPLVEGTGNLPALADEMLVKGWDKYAVVRTIGDCFEGMQGRIEPNKIPHTGLCLNPWLSCSVANNGDVVSCCMIFTPKQDEINYYGNLYNNSLAEIWSNNRVAAMRKIQTDYAGYYGEGDHIQRGGQCTNCTVASPCMIHTQIVSRLVHLRGI